MFNLFNNKNKVQFGLVNCVNSRGLGTESRLLKNFFDEYFKDVCFQIYKIPAGRRAKEFDGIWHKKPAFLRWLDSKDVVMTIEHFMPKLFDECRRKGIKTIWRPNQEWILPIYGKKDYEKIDFIMTPQQACADFLEHQYSLSNVIRNPWVAELPVIEKKYSHENNTRFLFNAGRGGIGNRRNHMVVIEAFSKILVDRPDIEFTFKSQVEIDISLLAPFLGKNFKYICKNTSYKKNLQHYAESDFSIAPSKWEGVGFALLESLYCGTPVITVDAPPMNEWVLHKQTGFLIDSTFPDVPLPIVYDKVNLDGLNWVKAALCDADDLVEAILWMSDHKKEFYEIFNTVNPRVLKERKVMFAKVFRSIIDGIKMDRCNGKV